MKKLVLFTIICFFSVCFADDDQININGYFDLESNGTASFGGVDIDSTLKNGYSFGINYLINLKDADLLVGPFFHYFNQKQYKGAADIAKDGYISFGGILKKNIREEIYTFVGIGFNIYERDMPGYTFSTKGGTTYLLGLGYIIQKDISAEIMNRNMSGQLTSNSITFDVTHTGISFGINYRL